MKDPTKRRALPWWGPLLGSSSLTTSSNCLAWLSSAYNPLTPSSSGVWPGTLSGHRAGAQWFLACFDLRLQSSRLMGFPQSRGGVGGRGEGCDLEGSYHLVHSRASISTPQLAVRGAAKHWARPLHQVICSVRVLKSSSPFFLVASRTKGLAQVGVTGTLLPACHRLHGAARPTRR